MKISIVSDEIALNFKKAARIGIEWGIRDYEIRYLKSGRVPYIVSDRKHLNLQKKHQLQIFGIA